MDIRLYNKARSAIEPFAFEKYRKEKIRQQIESTRPARLKIKSNLPAVNQELALKYMDDESAGRKKATNLLADDRFKSLFTDPKFQVDKNADEYKMLTPVLSRLEKGKVKELKRKMATTTDMPFMNENDEMAKSSDDDLFSEKDEDEQVESSDDDDRTWQKDLKHTYREIRKEQKAKRLAGDDDSDESETDTKHTLKQSTRTPNLEFKVKNITIKSNR